MLECQIKAFNLFDGGGFDLPMDFVSVSLGGGCVGGLDLPVALVSVSLGGSELDALTYQWTW